MRQIKFKKHRYLAIIITSFVTMIFFDLAVAAFNDIYLPIVQNDVGPTAEPTPDLPGVYILDNHTVYLDENYYIHVVGEVQNNTADHLRFVEIDVNIYDQYDALISTEYTYTTLDNLPAYDRACFELAVPELLGWSDYDFEAPSYWTDGTPLPVLTVLNDVGSYDPSGGGYEIIGEVRNDQGSRVEYVRPVATLYDSTGRVVGCDYATVNSIHLDPGQISGFHIVFYGRDYQDVTGYRLQVDGYVH